MKIAITGSHFTPAQAVIEELKKDKDIGLVYFGRKHTMEGDKTLSAESQVLPGLGVKFIPIISGRLQRKLTVHTIPSLLKIPLGIIQSFFFVLSEKPDVVLSFGGYVSVPVVISAWLLSIPIITHKQTLVTGLANMVNTWFADKAAVSFPDHALKGKGKVVVTGNPLRREILETYGNLSADLREIVTVSKKEKLPLVLITGGNQGSHVINQAVSGNLEELLRICCIIHQTGDSKFNDFENLTEKKKALTGSRKYVVRKWVGANDLGVLLKTVDLAVSRAGVNTLLELAYAGVPALVIPIPYLYKNEQTVNARFFEKSGLARILSQQELTAKSLLGNVKEMIQNLAQLEERAKESRNIVIPDAAKRLALETLILAKRED